MNRLLLKGKILLLMLIALGATTACDDDDDDDDDNQNLTVQSFMQLAAESDMLEIQTGNMATQKGTMADIKAFGQMLVTDHTKSSNEMKTLAGKKSVTLPTSMSADKMQKVTALQNQTGAAFDKQFAQLQVDAHNEAISLYEEADKDISDADVQAFIDKTLPVLRTHLTEAKRLQDMTK
jgi:putative membrane protein